MISLLNNSSLPAINTNTGLIEPVNNPKQPQCNPIDPANYANNTSFEPIIQFDI